MEKLERNRLIYLMRISDPELTLDDIGKKFGLSRQAVNVIVKREAKKLGKEAIHRPKFTASLGGFYATQEQVDFIEAMNAKNYSEKLRTIIQFYIDNQK